MIDSRPTITRIKEVLQYCETTGELRWLVDMGKNKTATPEAAHAAYVAAATQHFGEFARAA